MSARLLASCRLATRSLRLALPSLGPLRSPVSCYSRSLIWPIDLASLDLSYSEMPFRTKVASIALIRMISFLAFAIPQGQGFLLLLTCELNSLTVWSWLFSALLGKNFSLSGLVRVKFCQLPIEGFRGLIHPVRECCSRLHGQEWAPFLILYCSYQITAHFSRSLDPRTLRQPWKILAVGVIFG
jgi:hypothetical protein